MIVLKHWITNAVVFQSIWFLAFFYQYQALPLMLLGCALMLVGHSNKRLNLVLAFLGTAIGIGTEYIAIQVGLYSYQDANTIPLWLVVLWFALVLTLNQALSRLLSLQPLLLAIIFWVCAPPSYLAAAQVDVIELQLPWWQFWIGFGAIWSLGFLVIVKINDALKGTKLAEAKANW